jgi:FtsP/CotA-like multicopper oxidase with cupredoxin domain
MDRTRRNFLQGAALLGAGAIGSRAVAAVQQQSDKDKMQIPPGMKMDHTTAMHETPHRMSAKGAGFLPVVTPDLPDLPFEVDNGVKVFHLIAEPVRQKLIPGMTANLWGYNGSAPGPTIQINQGDRVRLIVDNHLPEPTSMHWHGFEIPFDMDGGPGISQDPIPPGGRFVYEFTLHQEGTYFYHSHMAMQEMMGMIGAFIMHPQKSYDPPVDKDFTIIMQEYAILPNNPTPNSMSMEFNWLTFNGKSGPDCTPMIIRLGERVRIRLINLGMDHHPIHLHGNTFYVTGTEGGRAPKTTWRPENTVLVGVAQARDIEFEANNPGDWLLHCHLPHHMMNHMSQMVGSMTPRTGMPAGAGMEEGMGMPRQGAATSEENGPSLGRGMGVGSTLEQATTDGPISQKQGEHPKIGENAALVPGFPQDAYMEGPMMAMDAMVAKPETYGLRPGWSGFMQGMMTLVRVLPPAQYDHIMELRAQQNNKKQQMPGMKMPEND